MRALRWAIILAAGGTAVAVGLWLRSFGLFSAGAAMIALRASAVAFGTPPSIGALGFDLPPLPILLAAPFAAAPVLRWDPILPVVVSAAAAGIAAWWVLGSLRGIGLGVGAAAAVALAVAVHPVWLYAAASGSGSVVAAALLVAALRLYRRWQVTGEALPMIASAFAMALASLARYDLAVVGCGLAVLVALGRRARPQEPRDERPAFAVAYAAAVLGSLGVWLVTTGLVVGDPLAFVVRAFDAVAAPPSAAPPLHVLLVIVPAVAAAAAAAAMRRASATVLSTALVAVAAVVTSATSGSPLSLDAVVPLVPLTGLLVGEIVARRRIVFPSLALALPALVAVGALALSVSTDWGEAHRAAIDALRGRTSTMWTGERGVAAFIRRTGATVVVDARVDGVVALLLGSSRDVVATDTSPTAASARPDADLILVRTPTGRGASEATAREWPTLYQGGVPWARALGSWPVSGEPAEYRLYAVTSVAGR
ncbi:MAG: hypothetical protein KGN00_06140 [Chloroflexota bacterium]|nr:hypothetical protein [Chloroflexota bacterium]MDE3193252.1 hypothetical protein [Chloroflexota bacterium]